MIKPIEPNYLCKLINDETKGQIETRSGIIYSAKNVEYSFKLFEIVKTYGDDSLYKVGQKIYVLFNAERRISEDYYIIRENSIDAIEED